MKKRVFVFTSVLLTSLLFSCTKDYIEKKEVDEKIAVDSIKTTGKDSGKNGSKGFVVYSTTFDWENQNYIFRSDGSTLTLLPWYGNNLLPQRMKHNHPKSEGWEMLYNTMDLEGIGAAPTFFALYNKYSGVMHLYYIALSYMESAEGFYTALGLTGNTSLMNFENKQNYGLNMKNYCPTIVKGTEGTISPFYSSTQLHIPDGSFVWNTWYGTEVEFAYEDVSSFSDLTFYLQYLPFRGQYQTLTLTGNLTGSIKGTIQARSSGNSNLIGTLGNIFNSSNNTDISLGDDNIVVDGIVGSVEKAKTQSTTKFFNGLWSKIHSEIPTSIQSDITNTLKAAVSSGVKWATNPLSAFVNSVFTVGSSGSNIPLNKVDLKINANLNLSGSISSQLANLKFDLKLPNTTPITGGYGYPTYEMKDWNLGVWNVTNLPVMNYDINNIVDRSSANAPTTSQIQISLLGASSTEIVVNPSVLNDCYLTFQSIEYKIESGNYELQQSLDNSMPPFSFIPAGLIQSYSFPSCGLVVSHPAPLQNVNDCNAYARVTVILTHKTTGKEFVHIKNFPLISQSSYRFTYLDGDPGPGLDF
jgi:hypothetical protein